MNGHQFGTRTDAERETWLQRRETWRRNNPAPTTDEQDPEQ